MIRRLHERSDADIDSTMRPTPEMLERRGRLLDELYGSWDNPEGERTAKWIEETFRHPDSYPETDRNDR